MVSVIECPIRSALSFSFASSVVVVNNAPRARLKRCYEKALWFSVRSFCFSRQPFSFGNRVGDPRQRRP